MCSAAETQDCVCCLLPCDFFFPQVSDGNVAVFQSSRIYVPPRCGTAVLSSSTTLGFSKRFHTSHLLLCYGFAVFKHSSRDNFNHGRGAISPPHSELVNSLPCAKTHGTCNRPPHSSFKASHEPLLIIRYTLNVLLSLVDIACHFGIFRILTPNIRSHLIFSSQAGRAWYISSNHFGRPSRNANVSTQTNVCTMPQRHTQLI